MTFMWVILKGGRLGKEGKRGGKIKIIEGGRGGGREANLSRREVRSSTSAFNSSAI